MFGSLPSHKDSLCRIADCFLYMENTNIQPCGDLESEESDDEDGESRFMYSRHRLWGGGRRELQPLELKLVVIERVKGGESHMSVATDLHISVGTVASWWLQRDDIQQKYERQAYLMRKVRLLDEEEEEEEEEKDWSHVLLQRRDRAKQSHQAPSKPESKSIDTTERKEEIKAGPSEGGLSTEISSKLGVPPRKRKLSERAPSNRKKRRQDGTNLSQDIENKEKLWAELGIESPQQVAARVRQELESYGAASSSHQPEARVRQELESDGAASSSHQPEARVCKELKSDSAAITSQQLADRVCEDLEKDGAAGNTEQLAGKVRLALERDHAAGCSQQLRVRVPKKIKWEGAPGNSHQPAARVHKELENDDAVRSSARVVRGDTGHCSPECSTNCLPDTLTRADPTPRSILSYLPPPDARISQPVVRLKRLNFLPSGETHHSDPLPLHTTAEVVQPEEASSLHQPQKEVSSVLLRISMPKKVDRKKKKKKLRKKRRRSSPLSDSFSGSDPEKGVTGKASFSGKYIIPHDSDSDSSSYSGSRLDKIKIVGQSDTLRICENSASQLSSSDQSAAAGSNNLPSYSFTTSGGWPVPSVVLTAPKDSLNSAGKQFRPAGGSLVGSLVRDTCSSMSSIGKISSHSSTKANISAATEGPSSVEVSCFKPKEMARRLTVSLADAACCKNSDQAHSSGQTAWGLNVDCEQSSSSNTGGLAIQRQGVRTYTSTECISRSGQLVGACSIKRQTIPPPSRSSDSLSSRKESCTPSSHVSFHDKDLEAPIPRGESKFFPITSPNAPRPLPTQILRLSPVNNESCFSSPLAVKLEDSSLGQINKQIPRDRLKSVVNISPSVIKRSGMLEPPYFCPPRSSSSNIPHVEPIRTTVWAAEEVLGMLKVDKSVAEGKSAVDVGVSPPRESTYKVRMTEEVVLDDDTEREASSCLNLLEMVSEDDLQDDTGAFNSWSSSPTLSSGSASVAVEKEASSSGNHATHSTTAQTSSIMYASTAQSTSAAVPTALTLAPAQLVNTEKPSVSGGQREELALIAELEELGMQSVASSAVILPPRHPQPASYLTPRLDSSLNSSTTVKVLPGCSTASSSAKKIAKPLSPAIYTYSSASSVSSGESVEITNENNYRAQNVQGGPADASFELQMTGGFGFFHEEEDYSCAPAEQRRQSASPPAFSVVIPSPGGGSSLSDIEEDAASDIEELEYFPPSCSGTSISEYIPSSVGSSSAPSTPRRRPSTRSRLAVNGRLQPTTIWPSPSVDLPLIENISVPLRRPGLPGRRPASGMRGRRGLGREGLARAPSSLVQPTNAAVVPLRYLNAGPSGLPSNSLIVSSTPHGQLIRQPASASHDQPAANRGQSAANRGRPGANRGRPGANRGQPAVTRVSAAANRFPFLSTTYSGVNTTCPVEATTFPAPATSYPAAATFPVSATTFPVPIPSVRNPVVSPRLPANSRGRCAARVISHTAAAGRYPHVVPHNPAAAVVRSPVGVPTRCPTAGAHQLRRNASIRRALGYSFRAGQMHRAAMTPTRPSAKTDPSQMISHTMRGGSPLQRGRPFPVNGPLTETRVRGGGGPQRVTTAPAIRPLAVPQALCQVESRPRHPAQLRQSLLRPSLPFSSGRGRMPGPRSDLAVPQRLPAPRQQSTPQRHPLIRQSLPVEAPQRLPQAQQQQRPRQQVQPQLLPRHEQLTVVRVKQEPQSVQQAEQATEPRQIQPWEHYYN